jgi:glycosyltransferase 2 family protein
VRTLVTLVLLGVVALQVDWGTAADRLRAGEWGWFAAAVALLAAALVIGALRWHLLLEAARVPSAWLATLRAYGIGVFSNNFLPTAVGGDAARAWIVGRSGPALVRALSSVAVDRGTNIACLLPLGWAAVAVDRQAVPGALVAALAAVTAGGVLGAVGLLLATLRGGGPLARLLPGRLRGWAREGRGTLLAYVRDPVLLGRVLALGLAYQALAVTSTWLSTRALELHLPLALIAVTVPLVLALTLIPLSIAGFGVREGGFVVLLGEAGVSATDATLLSLLSVAALALSSLPGALAMIAPAPATLTRPEG